MTAPAARVGPNAASIIEGLTGNYAIKSEIPANVLDEFLSLVREMPVETAALVLDRFGEHVKNGNVGFAEPDKSSAIASINAAITSTRQALSPGARASLSPLSIDEVIA